MMDMAQQLLFRASTFVRRIKILRVTCDEAKLHTKCWSQSCSEFTSEFQANKAGRLVNEPDSKTSKLQHVSASSITSSTKSCILSAKC